MNTVVRNFLSFCFLAVFFSDAYIIFSDASLILNSDSSTERKELKSILKKTQQNLKKNSKSPTAASLDCLDVSCQGRATVNSLM